MNSDDLKREMVGLLDEAIANSFESIKVARETGPARAALRAEIVRTRDKITKHPAYGELARKLAAWVDGMVEVERMRLDWERQQLVKQGIEQRECAERLRRQVDEMKAEFAESDPATKRMQVWAATIDKVLPFKVEDGRLTVYGTDQVIRSRGLVMAALAGMTSVGAPPKQEDAQ